MPRGMDERFEDPSSESDGEETSNQTTPESETPPQDEPSPDTNSHPERESEDETASDAQSDSRDEPLNIREDWDSATIYVQPEQSEDIEITFTRLKKQLQREDVTLEKNKHFYRGIFEVAFEEHREETKAKVRELAQREDDS